MKLSLTTPRGALVDTDVEEVTAPGELGELGVLPGHVPLMIGAAPGRALYKAKDHDRRGGGGAGVPAGRAAAAAPTSTGARSRAGPGRPGAGRRRRRPRRRRAAISQAADRELARLEGRARRRLPGAARAPRLGGQARARRARESAGASRSALIRRADGPLPPTQQNARVTPQRNPAKRHRRPRIL